jgi:hypothetical protein
MAYRHSLTCERLKELLHYDPDTGVFTWRVWRGFNAKPGAVAGSKHGKYLGISIDKTKYYAQRLAWVYMTGAWPINEIDHRDTDKFNNRFANLREATHSDNQQNLRKARSHNHAGFLGVHLDHRVGRYMSRITVAGKEHYLGCYATAEEAHEVYIAAKRRLHEFGTL